VIAPDLARTLRDLIGHDEPGGLCSESGYVATAETAHNIVQPARPSGECWILQFVFKRG
jgi:hypothetical protein